MRTALLLFLAALPLYADVLVLHDGRKLSGEVTQKKDIYEIRIQGETLAYAKEEVKAWIKNPKELTTEADTMVDDAKKLYFEAVELADAKAADAKIRQALPLVQKARDIYAETRDLFPDGHPELDEALVNIMKLMRLVRERLGSQMTSPPASPVKVKPQPPPEPKTEPEPEPKAEPKAEPKPEPKTEPEKPPQPLALAQALQILGDPQKRSDRTLRLSAREALRNAKVPPDLADYAATAFAYLSNDDYTWDLTQDIVDVRAPNFTQTYSGRLVRKSDTAFSIRTPKGEVNLRESGETWFVKPPGSAEMRATQVTITERRRSDTGTFLDAYFSTYKPEEIERFDAKRHMEAARMLAERTGELRSNLLLLFAAAHLSALIGQPASKEIDAIAMDLGLIATRGTFATNDGLAIADFHRWFADGEYDLGIVQFQREYGDSPNFCVRYAHGVLLVAKAVEKLRNFNKAYDYLEKQAKRFPGKIGLHLAALARSVRAAEICRVCAGQGTLRCNICKGRGKADFQCKTCGGSGKVQTMRRGVVDCKACKGKGGWMNADCPKCGATGRMDCKARDCDGPKPTPKFEDVAEAWACETCRGTGLIFTRLAIVCTECQGIGGILVPKADPKKLLK
ncbi:MAG: hypothetical protein HYY16_19140 [Planctomycetes bacterium]|nr:hypothetical protein [Planctomycetota bacterium]